MTKTSTARQILSDDDVGLLPYFRGLLQTEEFSNFEAHLSFQAQESKTQLGQDERSSELQTALSISLQFLMFLHKEINPEEATIVALELQEMLKTYLVQWSKNSSQLRSPISEIIGSFGSLEELRYHGGYLPGFLLTLKFDLIYSHNIAEVKDSATTQFSSSSESDTKLYSPGERTPQSGQYELINSNGEGTGMEVTSTQGNPLPPTSVANHFYKLVDPTKHKEA